MAPDNALIEGEPRLQETDHKAAMQNADQAESRGWGARDSEESTGFSIWTRRTSAGTRLPSETARIVGDDQAAIPPEQAAPQASPPIGEDERIAATPQQNHSQ